MVLRGLFFFCATAFAQGKIGLIDAEAFHDKQTGIREIVELDEKLDVEIKPHSDELSALAAKFQKLEKQLTELREKMSCKECEFPPEIIKEYERKSEEYDKLVGEYKLKANAAKELYYKRKAEVFADVYKRVGEALKQFAKEKGYASILDGSKMRDSFFFDPEESKTQEELTKEFVIFYKENFAKAQ